MGAGGCSYLLVFCGAGITTEKYAIQPTKKRRGGPVGHAARKPALNQRWAEKRQMRINQANAQDETLKTTRNCIENLEA